MAVRYLCRKSRLNSSDCQPFRRERRLLTARTMRSLSFVLALTFAVAGCGNSSSPTSPAAAANAAPTGTTAVINGTVAGGSSASLASTNSTNSTNNGAAAGMTVTVEGTNITATVNAAGQFVLSNVPAGTIVLRFSGTGANAQLNLGPIPAGTIITINVIVSGGTAELQQKTVNGDTEIEGRIESIDGSTLKVAGRTVLVTPSTVIRHGGTAMTLTQLAVGQRVHVKGITTGAGATTTATTIIVQNLNASLPVNLDGTVSGLTGTAASFTFTLDGRRVCGDAATEFKGGGRSPSFADLQNGDEVDVKGTQRETCVYAQRITFEDEDDEDDEADEFEAEGAISGLSGTCPSIAFTLAGKTFRTNSSTEFKGGACSALANGDTVEAEGAVQADGSVLAKKVELEEDDEEGGREWEARGAISGLTGTCPAITFTLAGKAVRTNSSTRFNGVTCASIETGTALKVEGVLQADGSVVAKEVEKG